MKSQLSAFILTAVVLILRTIPIHGQTLNPPYLSQMPSVERVKAEIKGSDPVDTSAQQIGALWQLQQMVKTLAGPRFQNNEFTPDESRFIGQYFGAWQRYLYKENSPSPQDQPRWRKLRDFYETDPGFLDELLQRFFSADFRTAFYRATGKQSSNNQPPSAEANRPSPSAPSSAQPNASAATGADAYVAQGDKYREAKDYPKAIEAYKRAIALNPSHGAAYYLLAVCYNLTKQWQLAISAWNHALALKPEANAFILLGDAHRELKQYDKAQYNEALKAYRSAIDLKPDSNTLAEAQFRIGRTYHDLLQDQNAVPALQEVLRIKPDSAAAHTVLGGSYLNLKQYPKALAAYQQAVRLKPDDPKGHFWIAVVYNYLKQPEKAVPAFQASLRLKPDDNNVIYQLGETYYKLREYPNALATFNQMLRLKPNDGLAHYHVGRTYLVMGRKNDALQVYRTLLAIEKKRPPEEQELYREFAPELYDEINKGTNSQPATKSGNAASQPPPGGVQPSNSTKQSSSQTSANKPPQPATKSPAQELADLQAKAERGDIAAQKKLSDYYYDQAYGDAEGDVPEEISDKMEANGLKWLRKAAESGDVEAQGKLGVYYVQGIRAPKNVEEGRKWLLKVAAKGSAPAVSNLCFSYPDSMEISKGIDSNRFPPPPLSSDRQKMAEAFNWCVKGANSGSRGSQDRLGWLYMRGSAEEKPDYEEAYFWLRVSKSEHPFREAVGKQLTPEKRAEIETRATAWKPTKTTPSTP